MALTSTTFDVPLLSTNQQRPGTSALVGQLRYAVNTVVDKYTKDGEPRTRLVKRKGFEQLPVSNYDPVSGLVYSSTDASGFRSPLGLFSNLNGQRIATGGGLPYVLADNSAHWSFFNREVMLTEKLTAKNVWVDNTQMGGFDSANIRDTFCYVWRNLVNGDCYFYVVDKNGTPVRLPTKSVIPNGSTAKVVSDGAHFFIIYATGSDVKGLVLTANGVVVANATILHTPATLFDVTFQQGKVLLCMAGTASIKIYTVGFAGGFLTFSSTTLGSTPAPVAVSWFENYVSGDDSVYLGIVYAPAGVATESAYQLDVSGTPVITFTWDPVFTTDGNGAHIGQPRSMTGAMTDSGLMVFISFLFVDRRLTCTVVVQNDLGGASLLVGRIRQGIAASRTFTVNGRAQCVVYYPSGTADSFIDPVTGAQTPGFSQPTYFLYDLQTFQMTGRWEYANAAYEWMLYGAGYNGETTPDLGIYSFHVPSSFRDVEGVLHVGLGYIASTVVESTTTRQTAISLANASDIINIVNVPGAFTAIGSFNINGTIGLRDYQFSQNGLDVTFQDEMLIPGPMAGLFTGSTFSEDGIALAPESPLRVDLAHNGSTLGLANGSHSYVFVWEWTSPSGERHRSAISTVTTVVLTGANNQVTFTLCPLGMTRHKDATLGVYRTWIDPVSLAPTTQYRKVSNDLAATVNTPEDLTLTYVDFMDEVGCSAGEVLYAGAGGQGMLDRDPCPAFRSGCVFQDRVFVIGWDNRIWYSAEAVPGDPLWFNQDVQVISIPTGDVPQRLIAMDGRIVIICDNSIWELDGRGFADPTGTTVNVTAPQRLPVNNGGTQNAVLARDGVVYEASVGGVNGGLFLLNRGLQNAQYSNDVQDEISVLSILGLHVDSDQNVIGVASGGQRAAGLAFVYSQLGNNWNTWYLPVAPALSSINLGRLEINDGTEVMRYSEQLLVDTFHTPPSTTNVLTDIQTEYIALGGVKNFHRCWQYLVSGSYLGPHRLTVTATADTNGTEVSTKYVITPSATAPYQFMLQPSVEEASRVSFRFQDDYTNVDFPGETFGLELVSLNVATGKGLARLPLSAQYGGALTLITVTFSAPVAAGLVLRLNGAQESLIAPGVTTFTFPVGVAPGLPYRVSVKTQPAGQILTPLTRSGATGITPPTVGFTVS